MDSSTITLWTSLFLVKGVSGKFLLFPCFTEMPVLNANSIDPDETLLYTVPDLGPHCLPIFHLWDARHKWVKVES